MTGPSMLALIDEVNGPNLWRVLQPITALERAGYPCGWDFKSADLLGLVAPHVDGYLLPRISWPAAHRRTAEAWFEDCRRKGKLTVYDADDDVFTSQETQRRVDLNWTEGKTVAQLEDERRERIWAMSMCDGVTVSTQRLATIVRSVLENEAPAIAGGAHRLSASEAAARTRSAGRTGPSPYAQRLAASEDLHEEAEDAVFRHEECSTPCGIGGGHPAGCGQSRHRTDGAQRLAARPSYHQKPVIVVPNAIDVPWFRGIVQATKRQVPGLTIGWAGGRRHDRDVEEMSIAWGRIAKRYPEVQFVVQGWQPEVIREHVPADRLVQLPWMKAETYPSGIAQVDIGCCAVADTPFNRAKSNIKAMEYAVAGAAVVASPTLYSSIVDHGSSGFLANDAEEWEDALVQLIERPAVRSMMQRRLLRTVERKHLLAGNLWRWPAAWARIQEAASRRLVVA